ncbi:MAG: DUF4924 family protein [Flavobacteriales bacterium]|nr:DUF4924 family protein [Flavobacteriales bacterium]
MTTAAIKKESHIVEYLLYVWQMEDVVRAANFDAGALRSMFAGQEDEDLEWVLELSKTMQQERLEETGHAAHVQETLTEMALLHDLLTGPMEDSAYVAAFQAAEPLLNELSERKMKGEFNHPVERMLTALYGWLVLRMRKEEVSLETEAAMVAIREMANALAKGHIKIYTGSA